MNSFKFDDLLNNLSPDPAIGSSSNGNIDKGSRCYHVITQIRDRSRIMTKEIGTYRHNLLCQLCNERNVTLVFSVTMSSHTHDVLFADDWSLISEIFRILNQNLSRRLRVKAPEWSKNSYSVMNGRPKYKAVYDIEYLFYLGKYIFDNAQTITDMGKIAPYSCFWMFEKDRFAPPYKKDAYKTLFGFSPTDIFNIYSTKTADEVRKLSKTLFRKSPDDGRNSIFVNPKRNPRN